MNRPVYVQFVVASYLLGIEFFSNQNKSNYVTPRNARAEIYACRVVCCHLVSHVEYAPRALLRLEKYGSDRQCYITLTARRD